MNGKIKLSTVLTTIIAAILTWHASPAGANPAADSAAIEQVRATINEIVKVVEKLPGDGNQKARRAELREIIKPRFDFPEMAKRSLGTNWNECSKEQQDQFTEVFSELLAKTYLARIDTITKNTVRIDTQERPAPNKATVKTTVFHKGETFPIDYRLMNRGEEWKVYDVLIENISLVGNYRNEFASIIRKEQFDGLMTRLRAKVG